MRFRLHELFADEQSKLSVARSGVWITLALAVTTIGLDIYSAIIIGRAVVPNAVYALETTMFMAFVSWAAGPRIAQYLGPQIGTAASALATATRDALLPSHKDDETGK